MVIFCSHYCLTEAAVHFFITANIITRGLFIIHYILLFIVCSSTVVGRISNMFTFSIVSAHQ